MDLSKIRLPITIIGVILAQAFGIIWYVAQLDSTVKNLDTSVAEIKQTQSDTDIAVLKTEIIALKEKLKMQDEMHMERFDPSKLEEEVKAVEAEIVEAFEDIEIPENLPERKPSKTIKAEKIVIKTVIDKERKKAKANITRNEKRKEWYKWKKRAKAVGIPPLKAKRPTKGQRKEWELSIIEAEKD